LRILREHHLYFYLFLPTSEVEVKDRYLNMIIIKNKYFWRVKRGLWWSIDMIK